MASKKLILELWQFDDKSNGRDNLSDLKIIGIKHLAFKVKNLEEVSRVLGKKGINVGKISKGASGARYLFLSDPDGIQVELYEEGE